MIATKNDGDKSIENCFSDPQRRSKRVGMRAASKEFLCRIAKYDGLYGAIVF